MELLRQAVTLLVLVAWVRRLADSCHGQGVLVKVAPVAWSSLWVVSARLQAVRLISPAARPALALVATRK